MSMKVMQPILKDPPEKNPKHTVPSTSIFGKAGITFSVEPSHGVNEGQEEFDVLKVILNREGYLNRLEQVTSTIGKRFKPEVADVLDLVRAASLDVIDMILRWREAKVEH